MVKSWARHLGAWLLAGTLAACGQTGKLYLPDAPGDIVTRPASPNSPQTADSPPAPPSPAPEVTAPVGTPEAEEAKKDKSAAPPPPK